jgi:integrase
MPTGSDYLHQVPRSPYWYYIRDVPADVRAKAGVAKWKQSLRTTARAEALKKARQLAVEHDRLIDEVRKPFVDPFSALSAADRERIESSGGLDLYLKFLDERALESRRNVDRAETLREWVADSGPSDEIPDPDWGAGKAAALLAEQRTIDSQIARDAPLLRQLGLDDARLRQRKHHFLADALASGIIDPKSITLSGVFEKWKECKAPSAPEQYAYPVRLFEELHGAMPMHQIEPAHVREFRDTLIKMPRAGGSPMAGLTLQQRLERAEKDNLPRLDESTAVKYFRSLKTLFKFAASEAYIKADPSGDIGFHAKRKKAADKHKKKRRSLAPDEISRLLDAAERAWSERPADVWFVRLLVYTGARPEELVQLASTDIGRSHGHLYLRIHDEGQNTIKNASSFRIVPVHPRLIELGFEEFVSSSAVNGLFPNCKPDSRGRRYTNIGRRLKSLMINEAKIGPDRRVVPYSLRHAFKDALRMAGAPEWMQERIMGHTSPERDVARGYGDPDQLAILGPIMVKVNPLDPSRIVQL